MKTAEVQEEIILMNRTGIMTNLELSAEMIQGAKATVPSSKGDAQQMIASNRAEYLEKALPIGSKPVVPNGHGEKVEGNGAEAEGLALFLDKLGERLAFERQGTRLYETVLQKCQLLGNGSGEGPSLDDLRHIHEEELEHFRLLQKTITEMGGDATVQTPSADVTGVLSLGILQIVTDPRTTVAQTLQAMLNAELADNDGWQMLSDIASTLGRTDLEEQFDKALEHEQEHLENVRAWLASLMLQEVNALPGEDDLEAGSESRSRSAKRKKGARSSKNKKRRKK
ncbi:MAG: ferritin-like domain-containing protein [Candidatus Binatia bacterium]